MSSSGCCDENHGNLRFTTLLHFGCLHPKWTKVLESHIAVQYQQLCKIDVVFVQLSDVHVNSDWWTGGYDKLLS